MIFLTRHTEGLKNEIESKLKSRKDKFYCWDRKIVPIAVAMYM